MSWICVQILLITIALQPSPCNCNRVLESPMLTDFGSWGAWDKCPLGTFVIGMQLKVESKQHFVHDDTALNGIRLICSSLLGSSTSTGVPSTYYPSPSIVGESGPSNYIEAKIESLVGSWGSWRSIYYCDNGVVVGFQMRSEAPQGKGDDTAANNLRIICSDGSMIEGEGTSWGSWTWPQKCPKRTAICAMRTQVELKQQNGFYNFGRDDTSLNNLKVDCCDIPNPAQNCTPSDFWELVSECDNTQAFTPTTCSYERKIGLGYSVGGHSTNNGPYGGSGSNDPEKSIIEDVGFSLGLEARVLEQKFQHETGMSERTGYPWSSSKSNSNAWRQETTAKVSFEVPPGVKTKIVQVVGTCGLYLVRTAKFQRVDSIESEPLLLVNETFGGVGTRDGHRSRSR